MEVSIAALNSLEATKFLSFFAVTVVFYDHSLNISKEIEYVWKEKLTVLALSVMVDVWIREACLIYFAAVLGGATPMDETVRVRQHRLCSSMYPLKLPSRCAHFTIVVILYGLFSNASVHSYILYRLYRIWDGRAVVKYYLVAAFFLGIATTIVSDALLMKQMLSQVIFVVLPGENYHATCVFPHKSWYLVGSWAGIVAFDLLALGMVALNVLMTPRKSNSIIIGALYKQGFYTFLGLLLLRIGRLLTTIIGGPAQMILLLPPTWALEGALSFRLFLMIKSIEEKSRQNWTTYDTGHYHHPSSTILVFEEIEMDTQ